MRVSKVTYRRLRNLGDYENESVEVEVEVAAGEDANAAYDYAKQFVMYHLYKERIHTEAQNVAGR